MKNYINNLLIINNNILINEKCTSKYFSDIIQNMASIDRVKNIVSSSINQDIIINSLELLYTIILKIKSEYYEYYFLNYINDLNKILKSNQNEE